jgi:hypothetical protein
VPASSNPAPARTTGASSTTTCSPRSGTCRCNITPTIVRYWHSDLGKKTGPTMRKHAYALLRTILGTAVSENILAANPAESVARATPSA